LKKEHIGYERRKFKRMEQITQALPRQMLMLMKIQKTMIKMVIKMKSMRMTVYRTRTCH
jgi:hypothetical protein